MPYKRTLEDGYAVVTSTGARGDVNNLPLGTPVMYEGQRMRIVNSGPNIRDLSGYTDEQVSAYKAARRNKRVTKTLGRY